MDHEKLELLQAMAQRVLDGQEALREDVSDLKGHVLSIESVILALQREIQADIETPAGDPAVAEDKAVRARRVLGKLAALSNRPAGSEDRS